MNHELKKSNALYGIITQPSRDDIPRIRPHKTNSIPPGLYEAKMVGWVTKPSRDPGWCKVEIYFSILSPQFEGLILACNRNVHECSSPPMAGGSFEVRITQDLGCNLANLFPEVKIEDLSLDLLLGKVVEIKTSMVTKNYRGKPRSENTQYAKVEEIIRVIKDSNNQF